MFKKSILLLFVFGITQLVMAQEMNNEKLEVVLETVADSVNGYPGYWEVNYKERQLLCLTDESHNRMRIISPIIEVDKLDENLLLDVLTANFHAALDVKYAISKGVLWSVFIHPLKELEESEVTSAVNQVVNAVNNFGTTFSSTEMIFGGGKPQGSSQVEPDESPVLNKL